MQAQPPLHITLASSGVTQYWKIHAREPERLNESVKKKPKTIPPQELMNTPEKLFGFAALQPNRSRTCSHRSPVRPSQRPAPE